MVDILAFLVATLTLLHVLGRKLVMALQVDSSSIMLRMDPLNNSSKLAELPLLVGLILPPLESTVVTVALSVEGLFEMYFGVFLPD